MVDVRNYDETAKHIPRKNYLMSNGAFLLDWGGDAAELVTAAAQRASTLETPCGDGAMVWRCWEGPSNKTPLIFLHGGWGSWTHWIKTIPVFAADRTIYVADLPGMGESADAPEPHTAEVLSSIVAQGVESLLPSDQPYHVVCFSFGGVIGTWMAAHHGVRCCSITLTGAAGFGSLHNVVHGIKVPDLSLNDAEIDEIHRENLRLLMFADAKNIDPLALYIHRHNISCGRVRSRRISLSQGLLEVLPKVQSPIGGIWGSKDATGGGISDILKRRDILRAYRSDCQFDIIEGAGHWVMYEESNIFNKILIRHIAHYEVNESQPIQR